MSNMSVRAVVVGCFVASLLGGGIVRGENIPVATGGCCNALDPPLTCCNITVDLLLFEDGTLEDCPVDNPLAQGGVPVTSLSQMPMGSTVALEVWASSNTCEPEGIGTILVDIDFDPTVFSTSFNQIFRNPNWSLLPSGTCPGSGSAFCFPYPGRIESVGGNLQLSSDLPACYDGNFHRVAPGKWARIVTIIFNVIGEPDGCAGFLGSQDREDQTVCRGIDVSTDVATFRGWAVPGGPVDPDADGIPACLDNCANEPNVNSTALDCNGDGDTTDPGEAPGEQCDPDGDGVGSDAPDGSYDGCDNCPTIANPGQEDGDEDGIGDACEIEACCLPGDLCEDIFVTDCANRGGTRLGPDSECNDTDCAAVPTVSQWGTLVLALLLLTAGTLIFARRGGASARHV